MLSPHNLTLILQQNIKQREKSLLLLLAAFLSSYFVSSQSPSKLCIKKTKASTFGFLPVMLDECWGWTVEKAPLWDTYRLPRVSHWRIGCGCEDFSAKRRRNNDTQSHTICPPPPPHTLHKLLSQMDNSGDACDSPWFRFWFMFFQT